jgi:biopolymer transport protein ExbD
VAAEVETIVITVKAGANGKPSQVSIGETTEVFSKAIVQIPKLDLPRETAVLVRADREVPFQELAAILSALKKADVTNVSIAVREPSGACPE